MIFAYNVIKLYSGLLAILKVQLEDIGYAKYVTYILSNIWKGHVIVLISYFTNGNILEDSYISQISHSGSTQLQKALN